MTNSDTAMPTFAANGDVHVPAFTLPVSSLISAEAAAQQRMRAQMPVSLGVDMDPDIIQRRRQLDAMMGPRVAAMREQFAVTIADAVIGGVPVRIIAPADGGYDPAQVLINLHGGAFCVGWESCALIESIPLAALGGFRVVTVDYRMAPEHSHPAGVEDVAAVYAALLESHAPLHIGIYGGSAGGALTAQAAAWLPAHGLPQAGAIGIFGAGGVPFGSGESAWVAGYIDGSFPPPPADGSRGTDITRGYFTGCDMREASVSPAYHADVLAKFPPTLIITGTRAMDLSPAIFTNSALIKAGISSTLIVGEGMGHCYYYMFDLPESRDAYAAMIAFFRQHLG